MAKPELGTKRVCVACGARFYDLTKVPAVCPKCSTEQPVDQPRPRRTGGNVVEDRRPKKPQTFHLWGGNPDGTMRPLAMTFHPTWFPPSHPLPSEGVRKCLAAVAEGRAAPPERLHLSDARSLHNNGQWRRAVIDAATAAEVGITSWIDANADAKVKADLAKKPRTLGGLWRLYKKLGGAVPDDFQKLVVDPRNDAAHRGMSLTSEQSAKAIDATEALLKATTPLVV